MADDEEIEEIEDLGGVGFGYCEARIEGSMKSGVSMGSVEIRSRVDSTDVNKTALNWRNPFTESSRVTTSSSEPLMSSMEEKAALCCWSNALGILASNVQGQRRMKTSHPRYSL